MPMADTVASHSAPQTDHTPHIEETSRSINAKQLWKASSREKNIKLSSGKKVHRHRRRNCESRRVQANHPRPHSRLCHSRLGGFSAPATAGFCAPAPAAGLGLGAPAPLWTWRPRVRWIYRPQLDWLPVPSTGFGAPVPSSAGFGAPLGQHHNFLPSFLPFQPQRGLVPALPLLNGAWLVIRLSDVGTHCAGCKAPLIPQRTKLPDDCDMVRFGGGVLVPRMVSTAFRLWCEVHHLSSVFGSLAY